MKGGGHATNPGFSSTTGVQISMTRFNETNVNSTCGTVEVGPGLIWDQVYATLGPTGVNVIGSRLPGVGVAGLTLGGGEFPPPSEISMETRSHDSHMLLGYSSLTSQYGLAVDNVAGYELVLPNGTIKDVTSNDRDLWFGLRVSRQDQHKLVSLIVFDFRED